ncbi:hypothetical protein KFK09_007802 [Dendrobium nobile]|uniref:Uncharacterized protein n=1 Tax=Dendrobium nobile TaxID=94219 RepID=A0A8T3BV41_DENNO|nr:hypothetical protein KFK09_007802 [Dendrobium nobile]
MIYTLFGLLNSVIKISFGTTSLLLHKTMSGSRSCKKVVPNEAQISNLFQIFYLDSFGFRSNHFFCR